MNTIFFMKQCQFFKNASAYMSDLCVLHNKVQTAPNNISVQNVKFYPSSPHHYIDIEE